MPQKKKPCTIDGISYESQHAAARTLGIHITLLKARIASSNFPNYKSKYHRKIKRKKKGTKKISCTIKGVKYSSLAAASKKFKVSPPTIANRLKSPDFPDYVSADIHKVSKPPKPVKYNFMVNGKKYSTMQEIGDVKGVTRERIRQKMNDPKHHGYRRL
ncbi:MAG: hypothetical protein OXF24_09565 [Hyphomicrobiales bacterium]|nr:hypothetical protein [Hyphomicrobiales bacterium]